MGQVDKIQKYFLKIRFYLTEFYFNDKAQTMTEYGLLIILIAITLFVIIFAFSGEVADLFRSAQSELTNTPSH